MILFPAIDLYGGRVVRLKGGDFGKMSFYATTPLEAAKRFQDAGCEHIHIVDLEGAKTGVPKHLEQLEAIAGLGMDKDGTKSGYDLDLTSRISSKVDIPVIASGGAGDYVHFLDAFTKGKADAVLAASLFHFNEIPIHKLKKYLQKNGVSVRV